MTRYQIVTSIHNFLDGQDVGDVEADLEQFMDNVVLPEVGEDEDLNEIADEAREILTEIKIRQEAS
jgi:hypothetical protein